MTYRLDKALVIAVLSSAPLFVYGISTSIGNLRLSRILLLTLFICYVIRLLQKSHKIFSASDLWVIGFLVLTVLSVIAHTLSGEVSADGSVIYLGGLVECVIFYLIFRYYSREIINAEKFIFFYLISSVPTLGIAAWQVYQFISGNFDTSLVPFPNLTLGIYDRVESLSSFGSSGNMGRISGATNEPNVFGIYMVTICILSYALQKNYNRLFCGFVFLLSLFFILLSFSKSALIALIIGFIFLNPRLIPIGFIAISLSGLLIYSLFPEIFLARFSFDALDSGHLDHRLASMEYLSWAGLGPGNFVLASSHSLPLTLTITFGILGFYLYLLLCIIILYHLFRSFRLSLSKRGIGAALLAVFVGLNLYDYFIYYYFWLFLACSSSTLVHRTTRLKLSADHLRANAY